MMTFSTGDPIPWFHADTHTVKRLAIHTVAGRRIILSFLGSMTRPNSRHVVEDVMNYREQLREDLLCFFGVSVDRSDFEKNRIQPSGETIRFFQDFHGNISRAYGAIPEGVTNIDVNSHYKPYSLLIDERLRTLEVIPIEDNANEHVSRLLQLEQSYPRYAEARIADVQAPILIVPRVFEPDLCRRLIELYESHGGKESGYMVEQGGKTFGVYDYKTKRRQDYLLEDQSVQDICRQRIYRRVAPEIGKAFQFRATRIERYVVSCYDGQQSGHFKAHRDNTSKTTAHRRFAVSLNLNSEDYEGGYVWFPEFGKQLFKPPTGGAAVFSCAMLHEATPVTRGKRYVFLPFLYGEADVKTRQRNLRLIAGDKNAPPAAFEPPAVSE